MNKLPKAQEEAHREIGSHLEAAKHDLLPCLTTEGGINAAKSHILDALDLMLTEHNIAKTNYFYPSK